MAWEWSHSEDAYDKAYTKLSRMGPVRLAEIWAEWEMEGKDWSNYQYVKARREARRMIRDGMKDLVVEIIWDRASEARTCDNGGHNLWMCPDGCGPHCV